MPFALLLFSLPSFQGEKKQKEEEAQHRPPLPLTPVRIPQEVLDGTLSHHRPYKAPTQ